MQRLPTWATTLVTAGAALLTAVLLDTNLSISAIPLWLLLASLMRGTHPGEDMYLALLRSGTGRHAGREVLTVLTPLIEAPSKVVLHCTSQSRAPPARAI